MAEFQSSWDAASAASGEATGAPPTFEPVSYDFEVVVAPPAPPSFTPDP
jgi:hypothetical protein